MAAKTLPDLNSACPPPDPTFVVEDIIAWSTRDGQRVWNSAYFATMLSCTLSQTNNKDCRCRRGEDREQPAQKAKAVSGLTVVVMCTTKRKWHFNRYEGKRVKKHQRTRTGGHRKRKKKERKKEESNASMEELGGSEIKDISQNRRKANVGQCCRCCIR